MQKRFVSSAFTIIEILVIVTVIGILVAVAIFGFTEVQAKANADAIKADMRVTVETLNKYRSQTGGYPSGEVSLNAAHVAIKNSLYATDTGNYLYCGSNDLQKTVLVAKSKLTQKTYIYGSETQFAEYTTMSIVDYSGTCTDLVGSSPKFRYGYTAADGWREWTK